jgi:hypothetical protein
MENEFWPAKNAVPAHGNCKSFLGEGVPPPKCHPLDAFGVSLAAQISAPEPKNPGDATARGSKSLVRLQG